MAFKAHSFIYDDICSEDYDLYIGSIGGGNGVENSSASTNTEFEMDSIPNRTENFIYRSKTSEPNLKFKAKLYISNKFDKDDMEYIDNWLFANKLPKKLVICQEDMSNYYYMATFSKNEIISVGNLNAGLECEVICDSPYAYDIPSSVEYLINGVTLKDFYCSSSGINYLYPKIEFTINSDNGYLKIKNITDNNREFYIHGLSNGETITIDKWFQVESSMGLRRIGNCNKKWIRFLNGTNKLEIQGNVNKVKITYQFFKAIGS
jgi:phage-related protein